jgi:hypothetical protein
MTSYYGDRPRDIPSWDSLEGGDDDDLIRSEVCFGRDGADDSINMLPGTISYSALMLVRQCNDLRRMRRMKLV